LQISNRGLEKREVKQRGKMECIVYDLIEITGRDVAMQR
jgi:hypothetical protein